jgi:hypothetical protein
MHDSFIFLTKRMVKHNSKSEQNSNNLRIKGVHFITSLIVTLCILVHR